MKLVKLVFDERENEKEKISHITRSGIEIKNCIYTIYTL